MAASFLASPDFSRLAGISGQRARAILSEFALGKRANWQGHKLQVRVVRGKGGNSGLSYEVAVDSLPDSLKAGLKASQTALEVRSTAISIGRSGDGAEALWWFNHLKQVLAAAKGSPERAAAIKIAQASMKVDWRGQLFTPSLRTIARRVAAIDGDIGMAGLLRRDRADKGQKRVILTRSWDSYVPFDDAAKQRIADAVRDEIRGFVKGGVSVSKTCFLVGDWLVGITREHGFRPNDLKALERACSIPKYMVTAERHYKAVYRHKVDRKASEDAGPRISRHGRDLQPMDIVVMDVHHVNVLLTKESGRSGTPKLLAFMDLATQRVWCELIFFDKSGGVRNTDVIDAFVNMAMHPAFGLPKQLYCDNGSEYHFADYLKDALALNVGIHSGREVVRARRYNAAAKPIEGWFGRFEQHFLKTCQGYIGDDRMKPMNPKLGKLPTPFEGGFEAFRKRFFQLLKANEWFPQISGLSPAESFKNFVDAGWSATIVNPDDLLTVFTKPEIRTVEKHGIRVDGRVWTGPDLDDYFGQKVTVRVPQFHGFNELQILNPDTGEVIGIVTPDQPFDYNDSRGAVRSAQRNSDRRKAIRALDKTAPDIDVGARIIDLGKRRGEVIPNPPSGIVSVNQNGLVARSITPEVIEHDQSETTAGQRQAEAERVFVKNMAVSLKRWGEK